MLRAGFGSIRALAEACAKISPPKHGRVSRDYLAVGKNLIHAILQDRAKVASFEQIHILCKALKTTPNILLGYEPLPGVVEQTQAAKRMETLEDQVSKLSTALENIAKSGTPVGDAISKILDGM